MTKIPAYRKLLFLTTALFAMTLASQSRHDLFHTTITVLAIVAGITWGADWMNMARRHHREKRSWHETITSDEYLDPQSVGQRSLSLLANSRTCRPRSASTGDR